MLSKSLRMSGAAVFLFSTALVSQGQPPAQTQAVPGQPAVKVQLGSAATAQTFRARQVLGSKILIQNNTAVGTVDDIVFDEAGNLEYLIVSNDNKLVSVPWEAAKFDIKNQTATVNITPEAFKSIPTFTATTYPDFFVPTYRTTTYKYYGVTPRELRRIERIIRP